MKKFPKTKKVPADTLGRIQDLDTNESDLGRVIQRTPQPGGNFRRSHKTVDSERLDKNKGRKKIQKIYFTMFVLSFILISSSNLCFYFHFILISSNNLLSSFRTSSSPCLAFLALGSFLFIRFPGFSYQLTTASFILV